VDTTIDPHFRKLFNYGPRDPRYLDCDDIDMTMALYEASVMADDEKPEGSETVETDTRAWDVAVAAIDAEVDPAEIIRRYEQAAMESQSAEDAWEETEEILHELFGDAYQPQSFPASEEPEEEE
jgi:hypothetical protein